MTEINQSLFKKWINLVLSILRLKNTTYAQITLSNSALTATKPMKFGIGIAYCSVS